MDLTGSIGEATSGMSSEVMGSVFNATGSSFVDTLLAAPVMGLTLLLSFVADLGADMGSSGGSLDAMGTYVDIIQGGIDLGF